MSMPSNSVAKSGWLYRQSSIMKKWKKYWFTLTVEGYFRYFDTEFATRALDVICVPVNCIGIKSWQELVKVHPPEMISDQFMFSVENTNGKTWILCGESEDDTAAWKMALSESRLLRHHARSSSVPPARMVPAGYPVYADDMAMGYGYGAPVYGSPSTVVYRSGAPTTTVYTASGYPVYPGTQIVQYHPANTNTIIYRDSGYHDSYYSPGSNLAMGLVTGAAISSLLWTPFMFHGGCW